MRSRLSAALSPGPALLIDAVGVEVLYLGFVEACGRFTGGGEPIHTWWERLARSDAPSEWLANGPSIGEAGPNAVAESFVPLFEALNWATSLDERIHKDWPFANSRRWYESVAWGATVPAVRFARHRVHHQWSQAFTLDDEDYRDFPVRMAPWVWVWKPELPPAPRNHRDEGGERLYRERLAGEVVNGALVVLMYVFGRGVRILHDQGRAEGALLRELLPAIDSMDLSEFPMEEPGGGL